MSEPQRLPDARHEVVLDRAGVRLHTFTAPESFLANSTHVIETDNGIHGTGQRTA